MISDDLEQGSNTTQQRSISIPLLFDIVADAAVPKPTGLGMVSLFTALRPTLAPLLKGVGVVLRFS
jgi:hypothetical protein